MTASASDPTGLRGWMDRWSALEERLSRWLRDPGREGGLDALRALHEALLAQIEDADAALCWLVQRAAASNADYAGAHALLCALLCDVVAPTLGLDDAQRERLTLAALTMNLAIAQLQDELAQQDEPPDAGQRRLIADHGAQGARQLAALGVTDPAWLQAVEHHHEPARCADAAAALLARALAAVDRYAALISPREHRAGRGVAASARQLLGDGPGEAARALLRSIGICPPGSFVRLEDGRVALVLRRGTAPAAPRVVPVLDAAGRAIADGEPTDSAQAGCGVASVVDARGLALRLDHLRLLQLARQQGG